MESRIRLWHFLATIMLLILGYYFTFTYILGVLRLFVTLRSMCRFFKTFKVLMFELSISCENKDETRISSIRSITLIIFPDGIY